MSNKMQLSNKKKNECTLPIEYTFPRAHFNGLAFQRCAVSNTP